MPRLFTAIDIPSGTGVLIEEICRRNSGALRWTKTAQLHLTLRFIGETDDDTFGLIREGLKEIRWQEFNIVFLQPSFFPNPERPRIFHLEAERNPELEKLRKSMEHMLSGIDIAPEGREFIPHITLARTGRERHPINTRKLEKDFAPLNGLSFQVREFILYSSTLTRDGAIHKIEERYIPAI